MRVASIVVLALAAPGVVACGGDERDRAVTAPRVITTPQRTTTTPAPRAAGRELARSDGAARVTTVATGLDVPWELAFLPDGRALITERGGAIRLLGADGRLSDEPVGQIATQQIGEGGLLGLAVDPDFERNRYLYAYRTTADGNEVVRLRYATGRVREDVVLVQGIRAAAIHDGGRLLIGPGERLFIATGDAGEQGLAQQDGLNGKVLSLTPDQYRGGDVADPRVLSTGHRNPQGLAWQRRSGRIFATEHGPDGNDEVNVLRRGANYGWPTVQGPDHGRFQAPIVVYRQSIAPSGATFVTLPGSAWTGDLVFGALVGEQIRRISLDGTTVRRNESLFAGRYGRMRSVVEGPDGALYALTNNTDGRGRPRPGDDRVLRIVPPVG